MIIIAKVVFAVSVYPFLITSGIRTDFQGIMSLVHRLNQILQMGLRPSFTGLKKEKVIELSDEDGVPHSLLKQYLRHYQSTSKVYDVTSFLATEGEFMWRDYRVDLRKILAYGDVLEFIVEDFQVRKLPRELHDLDFMLRELFVTRMGWKLYKMYLGENALVSKTEDRHFLPPYLTIYLVIVFVENQDEFQEVVEILNSREKPVKIIIKDSIAVGSCPATNFISEPFFGFSLNPVIVNTQKANDYRVNDALSSILGLTMCIGELYNSIALIGDVHELCAIARSIISSELHEKIGKFRINPIRDLIGLYGLKDFQKYEKMFHSTLVEDINYFRSYNTRESKIVWRNEGVHHFQTFLEEVNNMDAFIPLIPDKVVFPNIRSKSGFGGKVWKQFEDELNGFRETLNSLVEDMTEVIDKSRTTVQLNLAVIALFWTLCFTVLLSPEIMSLIKSTISHSLTNQTQGNEGLRVLLAQLV